MSIEAESGSFLGIECAVTVDGGKCVVTKEKIVVYDLTFNILLYYSFSVCVHLFIPVYN